MRAMAAPMRRVTAVPAAALHFGRAGIDLRRAQAREEAGLRRGSAYRESDCTSRSKRERKISHSFLHFIACSTKAFER